MANSKKYQKRWDDGDTVTTQDNSGKTRQGILEILSTQVFIGFEDGSGIYQSHADFKKEQLSR